MEPLNEPLKARAKEASKAPVKEPSEEASKENLTLLHPRLRWRPQAVAGGAGADSKPTKTKFRTMSPP